jgi:hypothetical protein
MVDWSRVSQSNFLEEFDFLHNAEDQIHEKPWAQPVIRAVMKQSQRIAQAHTEILRCNVELRRLHTAICNEEQLFTDVLDKLKTSGQKIYFSVLEYCTHRRRVNNHLLYHIAWTYSLKGFTGNPQPGVRKGTTAHAPSSQDTIQTPDELVFEKEDDPQDLSDDDELAGEIDRIVDYISAI